MTSLELKRLARRIARIEQNQANMSKPQLAYSSIENGNIKSYEGDDLKMSIGLQDDGSSTMRFFDGPVPPVPAGFTALADGPVIQGTWDGSFEDGAQATYDLAYLEVAATLVDDDSRVSFATITAKEGASASVVANQTGVWAVAVRSVSQAGKKSEFFSAGTVEVKLTDLSGAIEAVQDSANGKNKVTYSEHAPTPDDPGIFDDTWFVGQVGRPNDVVEATNLASNPSVEISQDYWAHSLPGTGISRTRVEGGKVGNYRIDLSAPNGSTSTGGTYYRDTTITGGPGQVVSAGIWVKQNSGDQVRISLAARKGSATVGSATSEYFDVTGDWQWLTCENMAITDAYDYVQVWVVNRTTVPAGFVQSVDGVCITYGPTAPTAYFDGDSPSGESDNESHYRWTGEPHASTSEKYLPALDIGDSDNWNVIEQYRHDGTGWVKVELSHYVFSTVDLGKATVGELDGIRIMSKTIGTEQLRADFADFIVARGATLIAGNDRHRLDDSGYALFDANGDRRTFLSPDGSTFKGEVEADTLVVNGGAELRGTDNTLAQGAKLTIAAGVTDPTAPPTVQPFWDGLGFSGAGMVEAPLSGLAYDGTNYWTAKANTSWTNGTTYWTAIKINASTGVSEAVVLPGNVWGEKFGVTCIGQELFWLHRSSYDHKVLVTDLSLVKKREFSYPDAGHSPSNPLTYRPGIGNDGTNIVIAQCDDAGPLNIRTYNKTTGALISAVKDSNDGTRSDITGVYVGTADWGGSTKYAAVAKAASSQIVCFNASTGVYDSSKTFSMASSSTGVVYQGGKFHTLDPTGTIHEYADVNTGDASGDWWAVYRWSVDADNDGYNDYTSRISPSVRFTWPRRSKLKFIGAPLPQGVGYITPSVAKKTSAPTRTDFRTPNWSVREGESVAWYNSLPSNWAAGAAPGDTNDFPEAESAVLQAASGTFRLQGDGSGYWGPLKMGRNGIMSGLIVHGYVTITPDAANQSKKVTITLPAGRFTKPPVIWAQCSTSVPERVSVGVLNESITTGSFDLYFTRTNTTTTGVDWYAMDEG